MQRASCGCVVPLGGTHRLCPTRHGAETRAGLRPAVRIGGARARVTPASAHSWAAPQAPAWPQTDMVGLRLRWGAAEPGLKPPRCSTASVKKPVADQEVNKVCRPLFALGKMLRSRNYWFLIHQTEGGGAIQTPGLEAQQEFQTAALVGERLSLGTWHSWSLMLLSARGWSVFPGARRLGWGDAEASCKGVAQASPGGTPGSC